MNEDMENSNQSGYGETDQYQLVAVQCKKCDETLSNNYLLRIHMRKHVRKETEVLKCISCDFESTDENSYLNHIIDTHSTVHICQNCNNRFPSKNKLIEHVKIYHGFIYTNSVEKPQDNNKIKCFDCGTMLETKDELMKHNREQHWK